MIPTTPCSIYSGCSIPSVCDSEVAAEGHDVFVYDSNDRMTVLVGLMLNNGVTNANSLSMLEIILIFKTPYTVENESGARIFASDRPVQPGSYFFSKKLLSHPKRQRCSVRRPLRPEPAPRHLQRE